MDLTLLSLSIKLFKFSPPLSLSLSLYIYIYEGEWVEQTDAGLKMGAMVCVGVGGGEGVAQWFRRTTVNVYNYSLSNDCSERREC